MRVLIADDSAELVLLYRAVLEDAGHEVVSATSGMAAIAAAESAPIDVAVLDVLMPGMSGDAIAERLRLANPGLPILLMTGDYGSSSSSTRTSRYCTSRSPPSCWSGRSTSS